MIFFSFIGLDGVATAGEEAKNPRRNLPLAIMIALLIVTTLYVLTALIAVAAQPTSEFEDQEAGLAQILRERDRLVVAGHRPGRRGDHLDLQRHPGFALRPDPHPVRDVARRHDPRGVPQGEPADADPGQEHDLRRHRGLPAGRV